MIALLKRELDHTGMIFPVLAFLLVLFLVLAYPYKGHTLFYFAIAYGFTLVTVACREDFDGRTLMYLFSRPLKRREILEAKAISVLGQSAAIFVFFAVLEVSHAIFYLRRALIRIACDEHTASLLLRMTVKQGNEYIPWRWLIWAVSALLLGSLIGLVFGSRLCDNRTTKENRSLFVRIALRILAAVVAAGFCVLAHNENIFLTLGFPSLAILAVGIAVVSKCVVSRYVEMDVL